MGQLSKICFPTQRKHQTLMVPFLIPVFTNAQTEAIRSKHMYRQQLFPKAASAQHSNMLEAVSTSQKPLRNFLQLLSSKWLSVSAKPFISAGRKPFGKVSEDWSSHFSLKNVNHLVRHGVYYTSRLKKRLYWKETGNQIYP